MRPSSSVSVLSVASVCSVLCISCIAPLAVAAPNSGKLAAPDAQARPDDYLLHLPGIAGYKWIDEMMLTGVIEGGFIGEVQVHDWPGDDPGLNALLAHKKNRRQAQLVAEKIAARRKQHPHARIVLTAHSGGTGILVWALAKLPEDVHVDEVLLIAPALSPTYDLSKALARVRGRMYAFSSPHDAVVLGVGTRTFGTIDGVRTDAAGRVGFEMPEGADERQYEKLVPMPYDPAWMKVGNIGDHIGPMSPRFSRAVLAPLVLGKTNTEHTETQRTQRTELKN